MAEKIKLASLIKPLKEASNNPEGDALVLRFLQNVAKKYDYPVSQSSIICKRKN